MRRHPHAADRRRQHADGARPRRTRRSITDVVRDLVRSYKQLPITLYQIQTKFRDEPRPRFGIIRTREFLMKDAYSFDADVEQLAGSYDAMYEAYCRVFDRCGLPYVVVEAESGPIGGDSSHEFMVPSLDRRGLGHPVHPAAGTPPTSKAPRSAPRRRPPHRPRRARVREGLHAEPPDDPGSLRLPAVPESASGQAPRLSRRRQGRRRPDPGRSRGQRGQGPARFSATSSFRPTRRRSRRRPALPMGFLGPVAIKIPMAVDGSVAAMTSVVVGGNEVDVHLKGVVPGPRLPRSTASPTSETPSRDPCPRCGQADDRPSGHRDRPRLQARHQVLEGDGGDFLDDKGNEVPVIMGCYGIGVNRLVAAAVEAAHDDNGILWPLTSPRTRSSSSRSRCRTRRSSRRPRGWSSVRGGRHRCALIDDRDHRPGVKFKDADLIGIPLRVVVGERGLKEGTIEVKWRNAEAAHHVAVATAGEAILAELDAARKALEAGTVERRVARAAAKGHSK